MIDATPSATPMPAQPLATVASTEAPFPPADPLSVFVPQSVTDPVSNLDFLPVDDAFALEMRSETIEQLVGGDALRRGESERIEAGRSQTNADLVAGRDRVRVHGSLHEHTGHGLAEQAAHLHTTVDGTLDVHAASEDTVLLAGHMSDLWDGGAAIVAAMTDDTVAGGGIRVTTPLDLWVHGLMGVEERIGTCTADAVLMESSATHYEREYGPGVHAAGLAVYTGSLYQSSRSTFRPLMRVSSGVRNLIAGGDGGGAGRDAGAGDAPGASPPPAPARTGAAAESASATLAAGRRVVEAPATALDTADALTDARRVPLDELVDSVDARAAEEMGEAGTVMRAQDLPELSRCADTADRLGALRETLRIDATEPANEATGGFRGSELEGAVSMHPAIGGGGALEIEPLCAVHGENALIARPHPGVAGGQRPTMKLELLGGADRPPRSAAPEPDFLVVCRRLRAICDYYTGLSMTDIAKDFRQAVVRIQQRTMHLYENLGLLVEPLSPDASDMTKAEQAYRRLQDDVRQVENYHNFEMAREFRRALESINQAASGEWEKLTMTYGALDALSTQTIQPPPAPVPPTTMPPIERLHLSDPPHPIVAQLDPAFPGPAGGLVHTTDIPGPPPASSLPGPSVSEATSAEAGGLGRGKLDPPATASGATAAHPAATETIVTPSLAGTSSFWLQPFEPVPAPGTVPFDSGPHHAGQTAQPSGLGRGRLDPPATASGATPAAWAATETIVTPSPAGTSPFWLQPFEPVPAPGPVPFDSGPHHAGQTAQPSGLGRGRLDPPATASGATPAAWAAVPAEFEVAEIARRPGTGQGASYPAPLPPPEAPGRARAGAGPGFDRAAVGAVELPFWRRKEIAVRFRPEDALLDATLSVRLGGDDAFGWLRWSATRRRGVLDDLHRLNAVAQFNISAAADMLDIDWQGIEMIMRVLEEPQASTLGNDFYPHG